MTTLFMFDPVGGFIAVDTVTRRTAYAYPSSYYADKARRNAAEIAAEMLAGEPSREGLAPSPATREIRKRDESRIALVEAHNAKGAK